jgi:hypothetical protein
MNWILLIIGFLVFIMGLLLAYFIHHFGTWLTRGRFTKDNVESPKIIEADGDADSLFGGRSFVRLMYFTWLIGLRIFGVILIGVGITLIIGSIKS